MVRKVKHIPENSFVIIFKFGTQKQLTEMINNGQFQYSKSTLESLALQKGAIVEYFTHP